MSYFESQFKYCPLQAFIQAVLLMSILNKDWVSKCCKMQVGVLRCCKLSNRFMVEPCQRSKIEHFGKIIVAFNYFHKILHLKSLRGFWIYVGFWICQDSDYSRVFNMPGFRISRVMQGLSIFVNMKRFWVGIGMQLWKGSEYSRIPNMSDFYICKYYTGFWIWLNNARINCSDYGSVLNIPDQSFTGFWICLWF